MDGTGLGSGHPGRDSPRIEENDVDIVELMRNDEDAIVAEALTAVNWLEHYGRDGEEITRERLRALCRLVAGAIRAQDLGGLVEHAGQIARERHAAGYDRAEVASAFSAVEEAIWHRTLVAMPVADRAWALGLVGTALGHAREALVRAFAEAGTGGVPAFVDLSPIFRGLGEGRGRHDEDMVAPV
jgi:hypothetical protein